MIGPVFVREATTAPRTPRHYLYRAVYVTALIVLMCTAWYVLAGTQIVRDVGDMARFGAVLFQILALVQLPLVVFLSALMAASGVAQEKDRRTLILLLMTRMTNSELVLGKLLASLLNIGVMIVAALPVFFAVTLFGGVSYGQVLRVFAVTALTSLAAGSLGSTYALWREKTFQTLAITALTLLMWLGACEALRSGAWGTRWGGVSTLAIAETLSPLRAIVEAARPQLTDATWGIFGNVAPYLIFAVAATAVLNLIAIARVRIWNPSREARPMQQADEESVSIWGAEHDAAQTGQAQAKQAGEPQASRPARQALAEQARTGHVDARVKQARGKTREVWDNPVLWREVCTWAYGRKVLLIRATYLLLSAMAAAGAYWLVASGAASDREANAVIPVLAQPLVPFFLVSLVIINALAVTSITNERDGQALDLLLVTDLSPKEFVFGKLGGVFWVVKEMILLPLVLCVAAWYFRAVRLDNLLLICGGWLVLTVFVTTLGIHCGMTYANSRTAIGTSLGTVFFLFLGVVTCMAIMVSFSGSFQTQLAPFLAFILGGSVGLYVTLGVRNPSPAILLASLLLPLATFHAITSFLLGHSLSVFLVSTSTYGFAVAAMLMPAVGEFDIAMGRTKTAAEE